MEKVNLADKLSRFEDHWNPRSVAELNGQHVKVCKARGRVCLAPVATHEAHVLLFEPASTVNTGEVREARTVTNPEHL